ncbi:MAG: HU family DNA-binding protein [Anaerolineae bacterium]|jgi:nucleoid DNA-binding protein|nr:HU family DNA-binding protein [Anaerolineae bacterium]
MTMTKNSTAQEIGRRTRLRNRDVRLMLETLVEIWTEELVNGGRVELEHFIVIDVQTIERASNRLLPNRNFRQITVRASKSLRDRLNEKP